jgi:hypothetical protein
VSILTVCRIENGDWLQLSDCFGMSLCGECCAALHLRAVDVFLPVSIPAACGCIIAEDFGGGACIKVSGEKSVYRHRTQE